MEYVMRITGKAGSSGFFSARLARSSECPCFRKLNSEISWMRSLMNSVYPRTLALLTLIKNVQIRRGARPPALFLGWYVNWCGKVGEDEQSGVQFEVIQLGGRVMPFAATLDYYDASRRPTRLCSSDWHKSSCVPLGNVLIRLTPCRWLPALTLK